MNGGPSHVATSTAKRALYAMMIGQGVLSVCLVLVGLIIHGSDSSTADTLFVGVFFYWLGHGNAAAQFAALAAVERASDHEG